MMAATAASSVTETVARHAAGLRYEALPDDIIERVRQCVLDTVAVTLAGTREPVSEMLLAQLREEGSRPVASVLGHDLRLSSRHAALFNGTAGHALDYDDCNQGMSGHVSVVVLPAVLALAEQRKASGRELVTAFAAGFEAGCRIGSTIAPGHYDRGFHATGTNGTLAAAAGTARLLGLAPDRTAHALSLAATMAAGLKGLFGTMGKPFHAGRAAENGLFATSLTAAGFETRPDGIDCGQGYADTHAPTFVSEAAGAPAGGFHLRNNLFKFHAACYGTHGAIECARLIRDRQRLDPASVAKLILDVAAGNDKTCNIPDPRHAIEARFSLRHVVGLVLAGYDTGAADAYGEASLADPTVARLRSCVEVRLVPGLGMAHSRLTIVTRDGREHRAELDAGQPASDLVAQRARLEEKFDGLVRPVLGRRRSDELKSLIGSLEDVPDIRELTALCVPA